MKKLITLLLSVVVAVTGMATPWGGTTANAFAGGTGTSDDPYQIATGEQLAYLASLANLATSNTSGMYYLLTANIDLNGSTYSWTPIGSTANTTAFAGTFDGNYHTITNLTVIRAGLNNNALFGFVYGTASAAAVVKNLTIASGSIAGASMSAAFVGRGDYIQLTNCKNIGCTITATGTSSNAGGIIGQSNNGCIIEYCSNTAAVSSSSSSSAAGGIVGVVSTQNASTIQYCYNTGTIVGKYYAGGIAANVTATVDIKECFNTGAISAVGTSATNGVAGIVAYGYGASFNVLNCYNKGAISNSGSSTVNGGILGMPGSNGAGKYFQAITNCYNTGDVTGGSTKEAIAGSLTGGASAGGSGSVTNCYYLSTLAVTNNNGGVSKTDADMQTVAFLTLINTNSVWSQNASLNGGMPYLLWQKLTTPVVTAGGTSISSSSFTANWAAVANASSYDVKVYDNALSQVGTTINVPAGTLNLVINSLNNNSNYTYTVTAKGDGIYFDSNVSTSAEVSTTTTSLSQVNVDFKISTINGELNVSSIESGKFIEVYNTLGRKVISIVAKEGINTIDIKEKGVLFVKVGKITTKVIL